MFCGFTFETVSISILMNWPNSLPLQCLYCNIDFFFFPKENKGHVKIIICGNQLYATNNVNWASVVLTPEYSSKNMRGMWFFEFFLHLSPTAYQKHPLGINVEMLNCVLADWKQNVCDSEGQTTWRYIGQRSYEHVIGFDHSQKELTLVARSRLDQECPVVPSSLPPHTAGSHRRHNG